MLYSDYDSVDRLLKYQQDCEPAHARIGLDLTDDGTGFFATTLDDDTTTDDAIGGVE